ncbi:MAG: hypothetical protein KA004_08140 [Verrucomicrobiales bacterium]|nr:hypothetical protein [Verrucomicrobiales bacterium]
MDIQVATLCDSAMDYNSKLCVLGTFDTIGSRTLPVLHRNCVLALRVCFRPTDEGQHNLSIRIIDVDGKDVIPALPPVQFEVRLPQDVDFVTRNMILHFEALKFDQPGTFSIEISVDGNELSSIPLRVVYMPAQG